MHAIIMVVVVFAGGGEGKGAAGGPAGEAKAPSRPAAPPGLTLVQGQWTEVKSKDTPPPRSQHTATWLPERQQLLVVGGMGPVGPLNDSWLFTPKTLQWTYVESNTAPPYRYQH